MLGEKNTINKRLRIGIIMGDAAGIGPEIIIKTLSDSELYRECDLFVIGSFEIMSKMNDILDKPLELVSVKKIEDNISANAKILFSTSLKINGHQKIHYSDHIYFT